MFDLNLPKVMILITLFVNVTLDYVRNCIITHNLHALSDDYDDVTFLVQVFSTSSSTALFMNQINFNQMCS